jgi:glutathione S-transferase
MSNATAKLDVAAGILDKQLATTPYLTGDHFTIAEVAYAPYLEYAMNTSAKTTLSKHPHLLAWWNKIAERPSWRKAAGRA